MHKKRMNQVYERKKKIHISPKPPTLYKKNM